MHHDEALSVSLCTVSPLYHKMDPSAQNLWSRLWSWFFLLLSLFWRYFFLLIQWWQELLRMCYRPWQHWVKCLRNDLKIQSFYRAHEPDPRVLPKKIHSPCNLVLCNYEFNFECKCIRWHFSASDILCKLWSVYEKLKVAFWFISVR